MLRNWQLQRKWAPPSRDRMESVCAVQWSNRVSWRLCFSFASLIMMMIIIIINVIFCSSLLPWREETAENPVSEESTTHLRCQTKRIPLSGAVWRTNRLCVFLLLDSGFFLPSLPCPVTVCRIIYFIALQLATKEDEGLRGESILTRHLLPFPTMGVVSCRPKINVIN